MRFSGEPERYHGRYEGLRFETGRTLLAYLLERAAPTSPVARWNVPIWVRVNRNRLDSPHRLEVGLLFVRDGMAAVAYADDFDAEQERAVRQLLASVWTARAAVDFERDANLGGDR